MTPEERVQRGLDALGLPANVITFDASTRTAVEAAAAVGCELGQIVKSLFFLAEGRPTLVLVAGDRQGDTGKLAELLGVSRKRLKMGSPDEVMAHTGYAVGGVSPVGLPAPCDVVVDDSLRRFATVWSAAGTGNAVFEAKTVDLVEKVRGQWAAITRDQA
jgi:prolyl-tRNA editing enzyme YbaK/EbsC (Cys-tRNA(Pro) deacylase)